MNQEAAAQAGAPRRRAGRPRSVVLDRDLIARAALKLVVAGGYSTLTMSSVAKSLGVSPSALYNHVESKQELMQWIQEIVMDGVDSSVFETLPLDEALAEWAVTYRDIFAGHAPLIPLIAVLPVSGSPRTQEMYEKVAAGFTRAGWKQAEIVPAIVALESFIFGSALDATAPLDIFDAGENAGKMPSFESALEAQRATGRNSADTAFMTGLRAIIAGLMDQAEIT
ncbi:TetR/AcrR family transcriptional regulator [Paeniglutamicibacter sp. ABSL32-1]|uniref:TetR/AcrR family transcriptional regulator n=1 Tax=Paeniglutamicibacter quisquiliarum TaxID=2849498 RepID=UPI001C2DBC6C|nr:TetR/AcrR family transcriptional regulator [Paeniglutamicibacter quisquiliarum]MBV1778063.1 TetR/AcrR family transcriptional regulator [Paeniglutamicibacter quisquiliarum]